MALDFVRHGQNWHDPENESLPEGVDPDPDVETDNIIALARPSDRARIERMRVAVASVDSMEELLSMRTAVQASGFGSRTLDAQVRVIEHRAAILFARSINAAVSAGDKERTAALSTQLKDFDFTFPDLRKHLADFVAAKERELGIERI